MVDIVIGAVIAVAFIFIVYRAIKNSKNPEKSGCGCSCGGCPSSKDCHVEDTESKKME